MACLPAGFCDDHFGAEIVEFVPELLGFQAAADFRHLLARHTRGGGNEWLRADRRRVSAEISVGFQRGQVRQGLVAG